MKNCSAIFNQLPNALLNWYDSNARALPWREDKEPYHVWLSEVMLQQTRVEAVRGYYTRFLSALPTIEALATAQEDVLLKLWEGLGYYNRVRNLQRAAQQIMRVYDGRFPTDFHCILALQGIGDYTAGAIASICFNLPYPAVDGNVLRVVSRMIESFDVIDDLSVKKEIAGALRTVYPKGRCGDFTQSLMELGATVCIPSGAPKCQVCPASAFCLAHLHGTTDKTPVRKAKKAKRLEDRTVFIFSCNNAIAVNKCSEKGVLCGMWEFPNVVGTLSQTQASQMAEQIGVSPMSVDKVLHRTHVFTHIQWNLTAYYFSCSCAARQFVWADEVQIQRDIALPSAFKQFLSVSKK